jgi:hypothetical protein
MVCRVVWILTSKAGLSGGAWWQCRSVPVACRTCAPAMSVSCFVCVGQDMVLRPCCNIATPPVCLLYVCEQELLDCVCLIDCTLTSVC